MDENRYFAMRKHLGGLAAEQQRRDAVAPMRSHDDKVAAFRSRGIDDRLVGTIIIDLQGVACDAGGTEKRCVHDGDRPAPSLRPIPTFESVMAPHGEMACARQPKHDRSAPRFTSPYADWQNFTAPRQCAPTRALFRGLLWTIGLKKLSTDNCIRNQFDS
jgi:hypothetical protein